MESRKQNVLKNVKVGLAAQLISYFLSFITRTVFLQFLSAEYLGVNNVFSNVLTLLSIAEAGTGGVFASVMYKPLYEKDEEKVSFLTKYMHKVFCIISVIILCVACAMFPFLEWIIGDTTIPNIPFIYVLFIFKIIVNYLLIHYNTLLDADQKRYISTIYVQSWAVLQYVIQLLILVYTGSFELYMVVQIACSIMPYVCIRRYVRNRYRYLLNHITYEPKQSELREIKSRINAGFWSHLSYAIFYGTDSMVITKMLGLGVSGIYSNYVVVINILIVLATIIHTSLNASVGNLTASGKTSEEVYTIYNRLLLLFMIFTFFSAGMFIVFINPFIVLWIGEEYLLDKSIIICLAMTFVFGEYGFKKLLVMFKWATGLFVKDKYIYLLEALLNLGLSIILGYKYGLLGVLLATVIASMPTLLSSLYLVCKNVFKKSFVLCLAKIICYIVSLCSIIIFVDWRVSNVMITNWGEFIFVGGITAVITMLIMILINLPRVESKYYLCSIKEKIRRD